MKRLAALALVLACKDSSRTPVATAPAPTAAPTATGKAADRPHHEDRHEAQGSATSFSLDVTIDGSGHQTWTQETFTQLPHFIGTNHDGEAREVWSLRDVATGLLGSAARVVSVDGTGATQRIDAAGWTDPSKVPILHSTRRGSLKFRWADPDGKWREDIVVRDVGKLAIVTK